LAIKGRKVFWALGAAALFLVGGVFGGLAVYQFFSPASPPADLPIPQLLAETHLLLDKGQLAEAEKNYRAVLSRDPANPEAITHLGNIAAQRGDVEAALRNYDEALRSDPSFIHALWDKGLALRDKGDDVGAIQAWDAFVRLVPADSKDAVTAKKWIAESQARLAAQMRTIRPQATGKR
jgi:tetratricopeptide (TPR) repeat protein